MKPSARNSRRSRTEKHRSGAIVDEFARHGSADRRSGLAISYSSAARRHRWRFDPQRGAVEVRARQIGANELDAIQACAAYVGVRAAYAAKKRSAAGTLEYAETVASSQVPKEFAEAAGPNPTRPYHGYYFRVLKRAGSQCARRTASLRARESYDRRIRAGRLAGHLRR